MNPSRAGIDALHLSEYNEDLAAMAAEIKRDARGRTCGGCRHYRPGWCAEIETARGDALPVFYPNAVACGSYEERRAST